jgi:DNA-binding transcriptional ArsR family regulator
MSSPNESADSSSRAPWYPEREDISIYGILAALSDPTRLEIVRRLAEQNEQCPFDFLAIGSKQNLTHHFKVLREAGLIKSRYEGRNKIIWLRRDLVDDMFPGLLDGLLRAVAASQTRST